MIKNLITVFTLLLPYFIASWVLIGASVLIVNHLWIYPVKEMTITDAQRHITAVHNKHQRVA